MGGWVSRVNKVLFRHLSGRRSAELSSQLEEAIGVINTIIVNARHNEFCVFYQHFNKQQLFRVENDSSRSRSTTVKKKEGMWKVVRQTCASHSLSCRLSVSTLGFLLLTGLVGLCSFPNKEIDKHLVWATPASMKLYSPPSSVVSLHSFHSLSQHMSWL